jgi:hypothetical protein
MAFNFGAFVGGVGAGITNVIEREKAEAWELKKFNLQESAADRRAAASEARATRKQTEELTGQLAAYGLDADQIKGVLSQGIGFAQGAVTLGASYVAAGVPFTDAIVPAVSQNGQGASVTTVGDQTTSAFSLKPLPVEKPIETLGFEKDISLLNKKILEAPEDKLPALREKLNATMLAYKNFKAADANQAASQFTEEFAKNTVLAALKVNRASSFNVGIDGEIENMMAGDEGKALQLDLVAEDYLYNNYASVNDPIMNRSLAALTKTNTQKVFTYKMQVANAGVNDPRFKSAADETELNNNAALGKYNIGDVVQVQGEVMMYTGIPDTDGFYFR